MNYLITFIQEVRVIQKQCLVRCVRQCLCSRVREASAPVPRPRKVPVETSPWSTTGWWRHLSQLYFSLGGWLAEVSTLHASASPRSLLCARQRTSPARV